MGHAAFLTARQTPRHDLQPPKCNSQLSTATPVRRAPPFVCCRYSMMSPTPPKQRMLPLTQHQAAAASRPARPAPTNSHQPPFGRQTCVRPFAPAPGASSRWIATGTSAAVSLTLKHGAAKWVAASGPSGRGAAAGAMSTSSASGRKRSVQLGERTFITKKAMADVFRDMLSGYKPRQVVSPEHAKLLVQLLEHHPDAASKVRPPACDAHGDAYGARARCMLSCMRQLRSCVMLPLMKSATCTVWCLACAWPTELVVMQPARPSPPATGCRG